MAARYDQVVLACDAQIQKLKQEKEANSKANLMFDESDQSRLLHLNKEINRLGLEVSERQLSLEQVRAVKDGQTALLHNCYLKKQTQLEDQRAEQEMEAHLNKGKSVDYNAAIEEQE